MHRILAGWILWEPIHRYDLETISHAVLEAHNDDPEGKESLSTGKFLIGMATWDIVTSGLHIQLAKSFPNSALYFLKLGRTQEKDLGTHSSPSLGPARVVGVYAKKFMCRCSLWRATVFLTAVWTSPLGTCCPIIVISGLAVSPWQ